MATLTTEAGEVFMKADMKMLHNNPVSQVTQAAQVLKHTISFTFERLNALGGITQCIAKFSKDGNDLSGIGRSADKKEAKMKAAEALQCEPVQNVDSGIFACESV